jgi:hypothetical protein
MKRARAPRRLPLSLAFVLAAAAAQAAPRAVVVGERHVEAGEVEPGTILQYRFTLRNDGDATLAIEDLQPTCYCTSARTDLWDVPPGVSTTIHVRIDPSDFMGDITKGVEITTNDPENPTLLVDVDLHVLPGIAVVPPELDFGSVAAGQSETRQVDIKAPRERRLQIFEVNSDVPYVSAVQEPLELEEKSGFSLYVQAGPGVPPGPFTARLAVRTSDAARPVLEIPVRGRGPGGLVATPERVVFASAKAGAEIGAFEVAGGKDLQVRSSSSSVQAAVQPLEGERSRVVLTLARGVAAGRLMEKVFVSTRDGRLPEIAVPIMGIVR